jgi:hypothetical protein
MVDLWSKCPIQKLWQIFKSISIQNSHFSKIPKIFSHFYSLLLIYSIGKGIQIGNIVVGCFLHGRPSSVPTPAHLRARAGPPAVTAPPSLIDGARLSALLPRIPPPMLTHVATPAELSPPSRPPITTSRLKDVRMSACPLEPSRRLRCTVASHHRCPPASTLVGAAPVRFRGRPLGDEVLEQAAPLAKLPLPNACRGGHRLALPARARSHIGRVRWHLPSCRMARLDSDALFTSPPPAAKGQRHACVASTRVCRGSHSLCRLCPRMHALLTLRVRALAAMDEPSHPSHPPSARVAIKGTSPVHCVRASGFTVCQ